MNKTTNKREKYNQTVIKELAKSYDVEIDTVRKCLRGDRHSDTAEKIKKDYKKACKALTEVTGVVLGNIINQ